MDIRPWLQPIEKTKGKSWMLNSKTLVGEAGAEEMSHTILYPSPTAVKQPNKSI